MIDKNLWIKILIGLVICLFLSFLLAYTFGTTMINENPELDIDSATLAMTMLLLPFTFLQLGIWTGSGAWLFGAFIGGAIIENYKSALIMASLSLIFYYSIGFPLAGSFALEYFSVIDIATFIPNIITMFIMTLVGALVGAWIGIRRLKTKNVKVDYEVVK
jgi:hypothetical protein